MGDRLSSLPDALLHAIMSFLPARLAVQTCVLSRRWEDLWCSMPCISIDQQEFDMAASGNMNDLENARESSRFEEFVNSLLMFHKAPSLEMFRFYVTRPYKFEVVSRWFRRGIMCCPAVVEISRSANTHCYGLPHLGPRGCCLRRLHLVAIYLDKTVMQHLSSACPVLEDLELDECFIDHPEISSTTLKHLMVKDYISYSGKVLMIAAPALVSLYLVSNAVQWNWGSVLLNDMPSLVNAKVYFKQDGPSDPPQVPCKILCSLINVRYLELSGLDTLLALHEDPDTFPTFSNFRTLLFNGCDLSDDFQMLACFLNNTPSLEKLTLQYCKVMAPTPLMGSSSSSRPPVAMGDRLSSLPDALLHTIMSFLPARQAVQTCVLSRRWEDLWCSMPCLSIDQQEFDMAASEGSDGLKYVRESDRFEEFVNDVSQSSIIGDVQLALHEDSGIIPTFSNLRTLLFNGCDLSDDFEMLGYFMNNTPSLEKLTLQYCKCPNLKLIEIKYKEEDVHQLFGLLSGIWRNLLKTTIILTKA
nr:unnamed protein product [Digitaria exilis]